jgi:pyruvate-formate lyase-activating enzyme
MYRLMFVLPRTCNIPCIYCQASWISRGQRSERSRSDKGWDEDTELIERMNVRLFQASGGLTDAWDVAWGPWS